MLHYKALNVLFQRSLEYPEFTSEAQRVCDVVNALHTDLHLTLSDYVLVLVAMKLVREGSKHKEDNLIDAINYLSLLNDVERLSD
jgi:hypothetical protein